MISNLFETEFPSFIAVLNMNLLGGLLLLLYHGFISALRVYDSSRSRITMASPRIFHPAFPLSLLKPLTDREVDEITKVREILKTSTSGDDFSSTASTGLPWRPLPFIGISDNQCVWSSKEIRDAFERNKHTGHIVWAEKLNKPAKGCILINNWNQKAIYLAEYDPQQGARGYEIRAHSGVTEFINWPPLALEMELAEKKWQPVKVSDNIANGTVLRLLPKEMPKAPWELILLLLLHPETHAAELQALFDTGLSPKQGLIAYMRLIDQVTKRAQSFDDVPDYRKITESVVRVLPSHME